MCVLLVLSFSLVSAFTFTAVVALVVLAAFACTLVFAALLSLPQSRLQWPLLPQW